ncbi:hypothetical protein FJTKL_03483 [Diaporthe vaccinii]|uniref:Mid2 domain-containing protein n=1 Tax=Diaporthe vaccinii TaxID=105482 RepID=A0ABR4F2A7_9PEZI
MSVDVNFFRSTVKDRCSYDGASMVAGNNTMRGNLCAYVEGETRVWACAASDRMCWTFSQDCSGDDTQRQCSANGADWCCRAYETCTDIVGQINVCWGPWDNPLENMSASDALIYNQAHYPVLPSLTTASAAGSTATESPTASDSSASGLTTTESPTASGSSTSGSTATEPQTASGSSLSLGSIIGIGVGCGVAGVALAAVVGFLLLRRRSREVSLGSAQHLVRPEEKTSQGHELSGDRTAEIDDGRWLSELPAVRT